MKFDHVPVPFSRLKENTYFKMALDGHWTYKKIQTKKLMTSRVNCVDMDGLFFLCKQKALVYQATSYTDAEVNNAYENGHQ